MYTTKRIQRKRCSVCGRRMNKSNSLTHKIRCQGQAVPEKFWSSWIKDNPLFENIDHFNKLGGIYR